MNPDVNATYFSTRSPPETRIRMLAEEFEESLKLKCLLAEDIPLSIACSALYGACDAAHLVAGFFRPRLPAFARRADLDEIIKGNHVLLRLIHIDSVCCAECHRNLEPAAAPMIFRGLRLEWAAYPHARFIHVALR